MQVANALYDVVFKYLLEDKNIAKLLLSGLLQTKVLDIELKPQEYSTSNKSLTVYRIDFKARIQLQDNTEKIVLIELQKAKFPSDIMRFRRYLGKQYANEDNVLEEHGKKKALPIITIYFLGYSILKDIPIIRVVRQYLNHTTKEKITTRSEFIESLTHDSIIVQILSIEKKKHKTELEKVLSVFEHGKKHTISIDEDSYPKKYQPIIRRLLKAIQDEQVKETMEIEDEILEDLQTKEREVELVRERAKRAEEEKRRAEEEKERVEEEKQRIEDFKKAGVISRWDIKNIVISAS